MFFRSITINDYDLVWKHCSRYGENSCQHSFINMFTLFEKYGSEISADDDFLYVLRGHLCTESERVYLFPMGGGDAKSAVERILEDAHSHSARVRFETVTSEKAAWLEREFPGVFSIRENRDYAEYIHLSDNLANLPGKAFASKRYDANLFRRKYEGRMSEIIITKEHIAEILDFERKWLCENQESHDKEALELEYREIELQLKYFDELKISGLIIRIDGITQGFVYGAPISDECYDVLIEKGNREFNDIYRILHQDIVRLCAMDYKYINREEDVGAEGLRKAKLSYKPDILLNKYIAAEI